MFKKFIILLMSSMLCCYVFAEVDPYAKFRELDKKEQEVKELIVHARLLITRIDNLIKQYEVDTARLKNIDFHAYNQALIDLDKMIKRENQSIERLDCPYNSCPELEKHHLRLKKLAIQKNSIKKIVNNLIKINPKF